MTQEEMQAANAQIAEIQAALKSGQKGVKIPLDMIEVFQEMAQATGNAASSDMNPAGHGEEGDEITFIPEDCEVRTSKTSRANNTFNGLYTTLVGTGTCNGRSFKMAVLHSKNAVATAVMYYKVVRTADGRLGYEKSDKVAETPKAAPEVGSLKGFKIK